MSLTGVTLPDPPFKTPNEQDKNRGEMLLKRDPSPDGGSPGYIVEHAQLQHTIDADYNSNSFNFSYDGSFSLSPHQPMDLEKGDLGRVASDSPKTFLGLGGHKSDKMISDFDGLSPLSVVTVPAYSEPGMHAGLLSRAHVLRFNPGSDTMLSALNYSDSELMQDGSVFSPAHPFSTLDGLLGTNNQSMELLDMEAGLSLSGGGDTFAGSPVSVVDKMQIKTVEAKALERLKAKSSKSASPGTQPCPTCGKVFSSSSALTKHKLTHSDERKYVCSLCSKAFKRQDHLNGHMLTHRNKKPYECDAEGCGKSYCDARSLRRHKENHHASTASATAQVSLISGFNSLPTSVITNNSTDRIQYAPPVDSKGSGGEGQAKISNQQIQFLAFQQPPKGAVKPESEISNWQQQTINTGALLLTQNFRDREGQGSTEVRIKSEMDKTNVEECVSEQQALLSEACFEVVNSSTGAKQLVALTSQGSVNLQFESVVRLQKQDPLYSRIVKMETTNHSNSSVPTTPTAKEVASGSPLLQQLLNQQQAEVSSTSEFVLNDRQKTPGNQQQTVLMSSWSQLPFTTNSTVTRFNDPKPVECALCQRKFKNVPALNGHMRLHGGYFKKETDAKKVDKKPNSGPPLQTASTNVRALIEEKINQKRNFLPQNSVQNNILESPSVLEPATTVRAQVFDFQTEIVSSHPSNSTYSQSPHNSPTVFTSFASPTSSQTQPPGLGFESNLQSDLNSPHDPLQNIGSLDTDPVEVTLETTQMDLEQSESAQNFQFRDFKEHFRVPHPPMEKLRRHSDSDHFLMPFNRSLREREWRPCGNAATSALSEMLRGRKRCSRVGSDPGEPFNLDFLNGLGLLGPTLEADAAITPGDVALPVLSAEDIPDPQVPGDQDSQNFFDAPAAPFPELSDLVMMTFETGKEELEKSPRRNEDSNDDDVFLSPTPLPTSPLKMKKKRRPEPLFIPPYVHTSASRLRSPRPRGDHSPPPYTPPPMLSPVRSGSGLFWHILHSGSLTPKSAPLTPQFGYAKRASVGEAMPEFDEDFNDAPESDILPHVNIGPNYQARIPPFNPNFKDALLSKHKADKVWDPEIVTPLSEEEVDAFVDLSCCALVPGGGRNKEYALHLLQLCKGNIQDAILSMMDVNPKLPSSHPLLPFQYPESDCWSAEEIEAYHQGLLKCDKDFFNIAKDIPSKSVRQCVEFYYVWKKVCPDEYRRLRVIRRRKEQESLFYNLRSKEEEEKEQSPSYKRENKELYEPIEITVPNGVSKPERKNSFSSSTLTSYNGSSNTYEFLCDPLEEFPCKICGKVFNKVKSRSAHMKSHRQVDKNGDQC